ncbi:putative protein, contains caspase domain [Candidatus Methanophagaceae archaeon]|nr:putative protein, contains caspase domain [Methanophagales archaeon]
MTEEKLPSVGIFTERDLTIEGKLPEEGELPGGEKRQAVIVGINDYCDPEISNLKGAVNDATDICQILKDSGKFEVASNHFLLDTAATCKAIRKAISDLLWQTHSCGLTLFYFSGHGFADSYGNGYLAPYDMMKAEPLVCGISMGELKQVILDSKYKAAVLIILDCCHSGIPTKGGKSILDDETPFDPYFRNLSEGGGGKGKIILASSEATQQSRETSCTHAKGGSSHPHGIFTFHLIEGLYGKASDGDPTGIITLNRLWVYVEDQIKGRGKQKPNLFAADASRMSTIKIAVSHQKFNEFIKNGLKNADDHCCQSDPAFIFLAIDDINGVLSIAPKNEDALDRKKEINVKMSISQNQVYRWLFENKQLLIDSIPNVIPLIEKLVDDYLDFDKILTLDKTEKTLIGYLFQVSTGQIDRDVFIKRCKVYNNPPSTPELIVSQILSMDGGSL